MQQPLTKKRSEVSSTLASSDDRSESTDQYSPTQATPSLLALSNYIRFSVQPALQKITLPQSLHRRELTHLSIILVVIAAVGLSKFGGFSRQNRLFRPLIQALSPLPEASIAEESIALTLPARVNNFRNGVFRRAAVPPFAVPDGGISVEAQESATAGVQAAGSSGTNEIITYEVESGDSIFAIAANFGLNPETIMWSNESLGNNPDLLQVGQELIILPVDGVYHQVGSGDTVVGIAGVFKADPADILNHPLNALDSENPIIIPGQWLIVPGGAKPFVPRTVTAYSSSVPQDATIGSGTFDWPASGAIYQGYWSAHPGIDIAAWIGAPVLAADAGYVVATGWDNTGYGNVVVIDHGNGFQSVYAHLNAFYVNVGDNISKGQEIAEMGSTGNSTGPHLHFEIRQGTVQRNPVGFLP